MLAIKQNHLYRTKIHILLRHIKINNYVLNVFYYSLTSMNGSVADQFECFATTITIMSRQYKMLRQKHKKYCITLVPYL